MALSGGVDSAVVALAAFKALGDKAVAITANYNTLSGEELESAEKVATEIGIQHKVIRYNELENELFVKNDKLRCYHCRTELGHHLLKEAQKLGIDLIVDGTNIDDLSEIRPGIKALKEKGIRSPMIELGIDKSSIRSIAKKHGISVHDKPSNSCLASRIPKGTAVTYDKLKRIEHSESAVKSIFNVRQVRVRDHGDVARIEVGSEELVKLFDREKLAALDYKIKELGFKYVSVDAVGYRSGGLVVIE